MAVTAFCKSASGKIIIASLPPNSTLAFFNSPPALAAILFPTAVEPFNGASTGSGGEIRDRMAGGIGSVPLAGTAVYMTSYPRWTSGRSKSWVSNFKERNWKYFPVV